MLDGEGDVGAAFGMAVRARFIMCIIHACTALDPSSGRNVDASCAINLVCCLLPCDVWQRLWRARAESLRERALRAHHPLAPKTHTHRGRMVGTTGMDGFTYVRHRGMEGSRRSPMTTVGAVDGG